MTATWRQRRRQRSREIVRRHYHDRGWQSAHKHYEHLLARVLDKSAAVLDVGCGREFPMAAYLTELAKEVQGVDPTAELAAGANGVVLKRGRAEEIPYPDESIDVVTSESVLEHLQNPAVAFSEFWRVLKPGGKVVFVTPNRFDYVSLVAVAVPNSLHGWIIRTIEGRDELDTFPTYYRANSMRQIRCLANETGFSVDSLTHLNHYPYLLTFSPWLCRLVIAYDELICRFRGLNWLQAWLLGSLQKTEKATNTQDC